MPRPDIVLGERMDRKNSSHTGPDSPLLSQSWPSICDDQLNFPLPFKYRCLPIATDHRDDEHRHAPARHALHRCNSSFALAAYRLNDGVPLIKLFARPLSALYKRKSVFSSFKSSPPSWSPLIRIRRKAQCKDYVALSPKQGKYRWKPDSSLGASRRE